MQIISIGGRPRLIQSKAYREYEKECLKQLAYIDMCPEFRAYNLPIKVCCLYYLKDKRKTDLTNLLAATHDILQKAKIIEDDALIVSLDGSRIVGVDKISPRVEVEICEV